MVKTLVLAGAFSALLSGVVAQTAGQWGQCGGTGWTGATQCPTGWVCTAVSPPWYYQCLQGTGATTPSTSSTTKPSSASSTKPASSSTKPASSSTKPPSSSTKPPVSSSTSSAPSSGGTLIAGNSFIRGVEAPYFHQYLQSEVLGTASDAVLGSPSTAAQFQITGGQLIQNPQGSKLYAQVEAFTTGAKKLKVTWASTQNTQGTFMWSGDTVEWSSPTVTRSQLNAWLICADAAGHNDVYINLGPYAYNTPAGCGDQTIHGYTGSTATA